MGKQGIKVPMPLRKSIVGGVALTKGAIMEMTEEELAIFIRAIRKINDLLDKELCYLKDREPEILAAQRQVAEAHEALVQLVIQRQQGSS